MQIQSNKEQLHAPFHWYRTMRATQPVFQSPDWGGWQVFRYADVARVLSEHATFSSNGQRMAQSGEFDVESDPLESSILRMDPPRHRQLRTLVSQAFTPRMVARFIGCDSRRLHFGGDGLALRCSLKLRIRAQGPRMPNAIANRPNPVHTILRSQPGTSITTPSDLKGSSGG